MIDVRRYLIWMYCATRLEFPKTVVKFHESSGAELMLRQLKPFNNVNPPVHAADIGLPGIPGYPVDTPCSGALGMGLRCVGSTGAYACQQGLVCFRWAPGYGACHPPEWIKTATISAAIPVQASTGCKADSGTGTPLLLTEKSWKGLDHSMCSAVLSNIGWQAFFH
jgi:hypothetical protein